MHACVSISHHSCVLCHSSVYLEPMAQALHPCSPLCFNADRLCWLSRVQATAVLLPPLKHILLDSAPQLKPHLCLICLMPCLQKRSVKLHVCLSCLVPCLQRKVVKPVCQCILLPDRTQTAVLCLCWLLVCLSAACL